jgi:hypothetical protein
MRRKQSRSATFPPSSHAYLTRSTRPLTLPDVLYMFRHHPLELPDCDRKRPDLNKLRIAVYQILRGQPVDAGSARIWAAQEESR